MGISAVITLTSGSSRVIRIVPRTFAARLPGGFRIISQSDAPDRASTATGTMIPAAFSSKKTNDVRIYFP